MSIVQVPTALPAQVGIVPGNLKMVVTDGNTTLTTAGYLNASDLEGSVVSSTDLIDILYSYNAQKNAGVWGTYFVTNNNGVFTLQRLNSNVVWMDIVCSAAALANGGKVIIAAGCPQQRFAVRDIRVNYSASGLSGGSGDRLLQVTDGTISFNNAGITAALLGTPVNTVWGGSGNPLPGNVSMTTTTQVAGNPLYATYAGGTLDYTTGSVTISVAVQRVA